MTDQYLKLLTNPQHRVGMYAHALRAFVLDNANCSIESLYQLKSMAEKETGNSWGSLSAYFGLFAEHAKKLGVEPQSLFIIHLTDAIYLIELSQIERHVTLRDLILDDDQFIAAEPHARRISNALFFDKKTAGSF